MGLYCIAIIGSVYIIDISDNFIYYYACMYLFYYYYYYYCCCCCYYSSIRCSDVAARVAAYNLLIELSTDSLPNLKCVANRLIAMHHSCRPMNSKEWEVREGERERGGERGRGRGERESERERRKERGRFSE